MNCHEFETIVGELAADQLMSAKARVSALAHAGTCEQCAARLADERMLTTSLLALAESTTVEAPARLKQSLRAAFDAQYAYPEVAKPAAAPNVIQMPVRTRQWRWALAAAATIAILVAVAVSAWLRNQSSKTNEIVSQATPTPVATPAASAPEPVAPQLAHQDNIKNTATPKRRTTFRRQSQTSEGELAASYIPLTYAAHSGLQQDKLVVRVEVPRSTLIGMGLPLNAERGNELVKADLMVGVDGVPLAIRFVQSGELQRGRTQ